MDLGEPIDLLAMLMPPLQPGPPPAAAFDQALAEVMASQETAETGDLASPAPEMQWSMGPPRRLPEPTQAQVAHPGVLDLPALSAGPLTPQLRVEPELPFEEADSVWTWEAPELSAEMDLGTRLPASELLALQEELPEPSFAFVAPAILPEAVPLEALALAEKLPESAQVGLAAFSEQPLAPQMRERHRPEQKLDQPAEHHQSQELLDAAMARLPKQPNPAPATAAKGLHQRLRDRVQHLAPQHESAPQGTRVLRSEAGRESHPLMDLEQAAGARWTQIGQAHQKPRKSALSPTLTAEAQPTFSVEPETPQAELDLPQAKAAPAAATQAPVDAPEEWVPIPKYLELEIDADLSLSLSAHGRELELSLDGSAEALAPLENMEGELRDSLDRSGWTLRDFHTKERGAGQGQGQGKPPGQPKRNKPTHPPEAPPNARPVPRGAHINRVA